jgi:alpha-L-rhamnosidase
MKATTLRRRPSVGSAFRLIRPHILDPTCRGVEQSPPNADTDGTPWLAAPGQIARWRLAVIRETGFRVCRNVLHPGDFRLPDSVVTFRRTLPAGKLPQRWRVQLMAVGCVQLRCRGRLVYHGYVGNGGVCLLLHPGPEAVPLQAIVATRGEPALLRLDGRGLIDGSGWECSTDAMHWQPVESHAPRCDGFPPHNAPLPTVLLRAQRQADGLWDFGRTILARPRLSGAVRSIVVGESPSEAHCTDDTCNEQDTRLQHVGQIATTTEPVAFRYLRVDGNPRKVEAEAVYAPVAWRGAFACSDERLNAIWAASAYTLRLCNQGLLLDGLKRDRMPWVGDLALSVLVDAYTFTSRDAVRGTLTAVASGGIRSCHLNGIVDYSLWWPIAVELYRRHSGDDAWTAARWSEARILLADLERRRDGNGWLRQQPGDWLFLDWAEIPKKGLNLPLQMLDLWCRRSCAGLATGAGDMVSARRLTREADVLSCRLQQTAWRAGAWRAGPGRNAQPSRHAALLAQLAGAVSTPLARGTAAQLLNSTIPPVGTPYMAALEALALTELGCAALSVSRITAVWGGMLDRGATTMWEAYDASQEGDEQYAFYGRPFAKSLCHAWSAGPAMLLPRAVFGLRPLQPGWRELAIAPVLGHLAWACATVPTSHGTIHVEADPTGVTLTLPKGITAVYNRRRLNGGRSYDLPIEEGLYHTA